MISPACWVARPANSGIRTRSFACSAAAATSCRSSMRRKAISGSTAGAARAAAAETRSRSSDRSDLQLAEEIVALVVGDDEGGEILDRDPPDRLHAELGIFQHLDLLDAVLGENRRRSADRA